MANKIQKFINYTKEAFLWPVHMVILTVASIIMVGLMILFSNLGFDMVWAFPLILAGLEFLYLGSITKNKRFIRAINTKYSRELQAYARQKQLADYYNSLSTLSQRRFDKFRNKMSEIKDNYKKMHSNMPNLVTGFLAKLENLQVSYIKLLFMQDKFPAYLNRESPADLQHQIDGLKLSMEHDSGKLKEIKKKRIRLLEKRIETYAKAEENKKVVSMQLQTLEEMASYISEQPLSLSNTDEESLMIDNILFETEQMQDSISDIESILSSDYKVGDYGDISSESGFDTSESKIKE